MKKIYDLNAPINQDRLPPRIKMADGIVHPVSDLDAPSVAGRFVDFLNGGICFFKSLQSAFGEELFSTTDVIERALSHRSIRERGLQDKTVDSEMVVESIHTELVNMMNDEVSPIGCEMGRFNLNLIRLSDEEIRERIREGDTVLVCATAVNYASLFLPLRTEFLDNMGNHIAHIGVDDEDYFISFSDGNDSNPFPRVTLSSGEPFDCFVFTPKEPTLEPIVE